MEKKFKLLPPMMPNYIFYEMPPRLKQDGVTFDNKIPIIELSKEEAVQYAELMAQTFINHWQRKIKQTNP
jgi:hypothetical protein